MAASNTLMPSLGALGGEVAARAAAHASAPRLRASLALLEGRQVAHGARRPSAAVHSSSREEHGIRRHGLVGRRAEALDFQALDARL